MTAKTTHSLKSGQKPTNAGQKPTNAGQKPTNAGRRLSKIASLRRTVREYFHKNGRDLPWRHTRDPYRILVSEIMLQQTQVDRVVPKYKNFLKRFPSLKDLAKAPLSEVLKNWQGLGYNRRAKMLHDAAKSVVLKHNGLLPRTFDGLVSLPGIGTYTAHAVRVFAWNEPDVLIETNVRTVFIHHFYPRSKNISDELLIPLIASSLDTKKPREWYAALMDYGTHLKATVGNLSRMSKHHVVQKKFKGSNREIRGAIVKQLTQGADTLTGLPFEKKRVLENSEALRQEGLIKKVGKRYLLA